jgi:hypothetical protein
LLAFYIAGIKKTIRSPLFGFVPIDNHFAGYLHPFTKSEQPECKEAVLAD